MNCMKIISIPWYMLCADYNYKLALVCAWDKEISASYIHKLNSMKTSSISWYMLCADYNYKLALACAWDKEILAAYIHKQPEYIFYFLVHAMC